MLLSNFRKFGCHHSSAIALVGVACVVIMMFFLGDGEVGRFLNGGDDRLIVMRLHGVKYRMGNNALPFVQRHDARAVLRADVVSLAVELSGVMNGEKHLQQCLVTDFGRVEVNFDNLCMPGRS